MSTKQEKNWQSILIIFLTETIYQLTYFCFSYDFTKFNSLDRKMIEEASKMIGEEIPNLMKLMPAEDKDKESDGKTMITGGIFDDVSSFFLLEFLSENMSNVLGRQ